MNSVALSSERSAIYLQASRANHACRPNGFFRLAKDGKLSLVARRRILAGEELCLSNKIKQERCGAEEVTVTYLPEKQLFLPKASELLRLSHALTQCKAIGGAPFSPRELGLLLRLQPLPCQGGYAQLQVGVSSAGYVGQVSKMPKAGGWLALLWPGSPR